MNVIDAGNITTMADGSSAIFAQSIGGGGGVGGLGLFQSATGTISLGGSGGANGNGGNVTVDACCGPAPHVMANLIATTGNSAFGIFAQSVGGGGGLAGNTNPGVNLTAPNAPSSLTASGSGGGNGGAVTVSDVGNISTTGDAADDIFAQSVGGGGGLTTGFAGSAGAAGSGGAVSVTQNGILATTGFGATAIFAQSAGGTGTGGNVTVNVTGDALAYGANADGILAQSVGGGGNGNIAITIKQAAWCKAAREAEAPAWPSWAVRATRSSISVPSRRHHRRTRWRTRSTRIASTRQPASNRRSSPRPAITRRHR